MMESAPTSSHFKLKAKWQQKKKQANWDKRSINRVNWAAWPASGGRGGARGGVGWGGGVETNDSIRRPAFQRCLNRGGKKGRFPDELQRTRTDDGNVQWLAPPPAVCWGGVGGALSV